MRCVVDRNIAMRRMTVISSKTMGLIYRTPLRYIRTRYRSSTRQREL